MRLTKRFEDGSYYSDYYGEKNAETQKLGQLEDLMKSYKIEDRGRLEDLISAGLIYESVSKDIGIGLDILFKALKDGIWVKFAGEKPYHVKAPISLKGIDRAGEVFHFTLCYPISYNTIQELLLKDYGKTWALTEEELENE